jgi:hypothetical protein
LLGEVAADEHGAFQTDALALQSLSGQLVITKWSGDGHAMVARATTTLGVTGLGERVDVPAALRVSATRDDVFGPSLRLDETPALPVDSRAVLAEMVGTRTEGDLLREIADAAHDEDAARDLKRTLGAFLTLHPEECDAVARAIAQSTPADAGARMALTALARAGHLEAQRAMVSVAKAWGARGQAGAVLSLLGSFAEPSAETEAYLRARRDDPAPDVAIHAEEALADIAAHLRERDPARADAIAADIEARVARSAGQPAALAQELLVLGNTRSERAEEVALQYVGSSQASVRRMAVYAIGRALDDEGRALLSKIAQEDPDAQVRDEALRALATST